MKDPHIVDADSLGAFCTHAPRTPRSGRASGPLSSLMFAVKDLIDVEGMRTGGGNPDWLKDQSPAERNAYAVARALDGGATFVGKTVTDELAFSLTGLNVHYGMPINPRAPDRTPGGSSSGSASVVAAGLVDFALGTDTGGSVRVPTSYCALYGIRPTHDRISLDGVMRFAPSFDTVGWFARDAATLQLVGETLLPGFSTQAAVAKVLRVDDAFLRADPETRALCDALLERAAALVKECGQVTVCPTSLEEWTLVFRTLRSIEVWRNKGPWIERAKPRFGTEIARNFAVASKTTEADVARTRPVRHAIQQSLDDLLADNVVLALPTTPGPPPLRGASDGELDKLRDRTQALTCIAGLGALPQISIPAGTVGGGPVGVSFIAARGRDEQLLSLAIRLAAASG
jgi:amidase